MALTCPIGFDTQKLRDQVSEIYDRVARRPEGDFPFHRGPDYARDVLGYDSGELAEIPAACAASFAGVGNPHAIDALRRGESVLDVGCGAGLDLLLAARRVGPEGRAVGVDPTAAMLERARSAATSAGLSHVELRRGDAESLPAGDASADAVLSNGALSLTTDKMAALSEIERVLRPGGRLLLAGMLVEEELSEEVRGDPDLWSA